MDELTEVKLLLNDNLFLDDSWVQKSTPERVTHLLQLYLTKCNEVTLLQEKYDVAKKVAEQKIKELEQVKSLVKY